MTDRKSNPYLQPAFLICVTLLLLACVGKEIFLGSKLITKIHVDLKKSFDDIDREKLAPYVVEHEDEITDKDILKSLGTEDYIQWVIEDTEVSQSSPVRYCQLFITYYGKPDPRVPHVPEECFIGSGSKQKESKSLTLTVEDYSEPVDIKLLVFVKQNSDMLGETEFSRMYFFKVDDSFASGRTNVRNALQKNFGKYSFLSKVEWQFFGYGIDGTIQPTEEQIIEASEKLMKTILPILENEHWPNLDELAVDQEIDETNVETDNKLNN